MAYLSGSNEAQNNHCLLISHLELQGLINIGTTAPWNLPDCTIEAYLSLELCCSVGSFSF